MLQNKYAFDVNKFYLDSCTSGLLLLQMVEHHNYYRIYRGIIWVVMLSTKIA